MKRARVVVRRQAVESMQRGHPWVWSDWIASVDGDTSNSEALITDEHRRILGTGLYDARSPIAVRVWEWESDTPLAKVMAARLDEAVALRRSLFARGNTDAYRVLNGEGDFVPGVVLDRYGATGVLRLDSDACMPLVREVVPTAEDLLRDIGIETVVIKPKKRERGQPEAIVGRWQDALVRAHEHGVPLFADVARGQKTGAFLDQRENRRRVGNLARGRRVLNLYSYAGGFSLWSALGGASHVTSVDIAADAHHVARRSFASAGLDADKHDFVTHDVFAFLSQAKQRGETWDLIVSDPPSFAPSEKALPKAVTAYRRLHRACVDVLRPGGILCAASCSSHVPMATFFRTLDRLALGSRELRATESAGLPEDHPTTPAWTEGRYLKFVVLR